jgi:AcrR family transcriptional regulator
MSRIVDVAIAQIDAEGEPGLRVNDVARASGVSVATLYHYFGDREGVVVAARTKQFHEHSAFDHEVFTSILDSSTNADEFRRKMFETLGAVTERGTMQSRFIRAEIVGSSRTRPALAAALRDHFMQQAESLEKIFLQAQERGLLERDLAPRCLAEMTLSIHAGSAASDLLVAS